MLKLLLSITVVWAVLLALFFVCRSSAEAEYMRQYGCHWTLADKASTIVAKQDKIKAFVEALEEGRSRGAFAQNDAIIFPTPDNAMATNLEMVKTLDQRLSEIRAMDPKSFEYNTAIQQITAQEQGEAHKMISVFYGCWLLQSHLLLWDWVGNTVAGVLCFVVICSPAFAFGVFLDQN